MNRSLILNKNIILLGIPLGLFGILILLIQSFFPSGSATLSLAITVDLLLTIPLVYFLLIRKSTIPTTTVIPVMIAGLLIGSYFLPKEDQIYLALFKTWALPILEVSILAFVIIKVRSAVRGYKKVKGHSPDFFSALKSTCYEILPSKLVLPFATEIAVIYYGFINWKALEPQSNEFTYHKKSGTPALLGVLIFMIVIETFTLHLLLASWNPIVAWIMTGLSTYTAIQVWGFVKSLSKRPITINKSSLTLRYGILYETEILFSDIEAIKLSKRPLEKNELAGTLSPLGDLESHNMIIHLNREHELAGFYGMKKKFKILGFHVDEPVKFKKKVDNALQQNI